MDLDMTAFFLKLVENNAILSVALFLFYFGIKKGMEYHNIQTNKIMKLQEQKNKESEEVAARETQIRVMRRDSEIAAIKQENKELRRDMETRMDGMEKRHDVFEQKLTRNLDKVYSKLEEISEYMTYLKAADGLNRRKTDKRELPPRNNRENYSDS